MQSVLLFFRPVVATYIQYNLLLISAYGSMNQLANSYCREGGSRGPVTHIDSIDVHPTEPWRDIDLIVRVDIDQAKLVPI
jgi:hypothetical protein